MSDILGKITCGVTIFAKGFGQAVSDPGTITLSAAAGLIDGLKADKTAKDSVKVGIETLAIYGVTNGVLAVITNWDLVKES